MIRDELIQKLRNRPLSVFAIFVPMVRSDSIGLARAAATKLARHGIASFWDGQRGLAREFARVVTLPAGQAIAWDVYFVYGPGVVWGRTPPRPGFWMHQLAMDERRLDGRLLRSAVEEEMKMVEGPRPRLTFLTRAGCVNTPRMQQNLHLALKRLRWKEPPETVNVDSLPALDVRRAFGTPTILVEGRDLMGLPAPAGSERPPT